jgi:hypothetical protein
MPDQSSERRTTPQSGLDRRMADLERRTREHSESIAALEQQHAVLMNDVRWILKTSVASAGVIAAIMSIAANLLSGAM